jgi:hypothetical protein
VDACLGWQVVFYPLQFFPGANCASTAQVGKHSQGHRSLTGCKRCCCRPTWQDELMNSSRVQTVCLPPNLARIACARPGVLGANCVAAAQPGDLAASTTQASGANCVAAAQPGKRLPLLGKVYEGVVNTCLWVANLTRTPKRGGRPGQAAHRNVLHFLV